jgi:hypothetical protein
MVDLSLRKIVTTASLNDIHEMSLQTRLSEHSDPGNVDASFAWGFSIAL